MFFLVVCRFFCIFPFDFDEKKKRKYTMNNSKLYLCRLIFFNVLIVAFMLKKCYQVILEHSLEKLVFTVCLFMIIAAQYEWSVFNYINRGKFGQFVRNLENFQATLRQHTKSPTNAPNNYIVLMQMVFLFGFALYLSTIYFLFQPIELAFETNLFLTLPKMLVVLKTFLSVHFLLIFHGIGANLCETLAQPDDNFYFLYKTYLAYTWLLREFNGLFGLQSLIHYVFYLCWNIYEMFHFVIMMMDTNSTTKYYKMLAMSYTVLFTTVMLYWMAVCHMTRNQARKFQNLWVGSVRKRETHYLLLTIKLHAEDVTITAMDCFVLDLKLFVSAMGSLISLIAILTQFTTKH